LLFIYKNKIPKNIVININVKDFNCDTSLSKDEATIVRINENKERNKNHLIIECFNKSSDYNKYHIF